MSRSEAEFKAYNDLTDALEDLLDGHDYDLIIPALTVTLGTILVESKQDKNKSLKFICNSVIKLYEYLDDEEDESC